MMRIMICDDEKEICGFMEAKIRKMYPSAAVAVCHSGEELLADKEGADILLLDIQMAGISGMEAARELRRRKERAILIFITALEEYVFQAFDVGAFHYLVKPFSEEKFAEVLRAAEKQCEKREVPPREERSVLIKQGGIHTRVKLDEVIYAEVFNRKVVLHRIGGDIEYYGRLSELEKFAGKDFFRTHRAYLVNLHYVLQYNAGTVWLESGGRALIAKKKFPEFVKQYLKFNTLAEINHADSGQKG